MTGPKPMLIPAREGDWDWAQVQYESTDKPAATIAVEIGVTATSLIGRASREGWTRDKGKLVARMTAEMVLANRERQAEAKTRELEVIERVNAQMQAQVLSTHRTDIARARQACNGMWAELTANADDLDLDARSNVLRRLADSMKVLMLLERQAYGIQGVFEDVEKQTDTTPAPSVTDAVLGKFAAVLAKRMGAVEVVENDT